MHAYATVQQLLCHGSYCQHILCLAQTLCRLSFTGRPPAAPTPTGNPSPDPVRSKNPSKSTLAHDAVAAAVLHKHHPIICVGAGLIQFVYGSHSRLATGVTSSRILFPPFFCATVVTFLHKHVFHPKALVVNWHTPREKKALEHMAHGRVLWLDAMALEHMAHGRIFWLDATHEGERTSIIDIHQATARRPDLQRRVHTHIQAEIKKSGVRRRIMAGDLNVATSRTGYSISTKSPFEKVDNQFQEFIQRTGGSLVQSESRTRKDLMGGASLDDIKSATLDHIITWNFSNDDTAEMPAPKSTVHWVGAYANKHALISCTIDELLLTYQDPWARDPGGRTGGIKAKKNDPQQIPRIQSKREVIMRSIAQLGKSSLTLTRESVLKRWVSGV